MAVFINFLTINVNSQNTDTAVAVGSNNLSGWDAHQKQQMGVGSFFGVSWAVGLATTVIDNDVIDAPINDQDIKPSVNAQAT